MVRMCSAATRSWDGGLMADLVSVFAQAAAEAGDRTALIAPGARVSFSELDRRAAAFAARCAAKRIGKGDRIIVAMPVGIDLFVALSAAWRLGAVVVFPEPSMGLKGFLHAARVTGPTVFFASGAYRWLRLLPALWRCRMITPSADDTGDVQPTKLDPDDLALISFTSGSTGVPKAIPRSHGFLMAQHDAVAPLLASGNDEVDLVAFPVFTLVNLAAGRTSVLPNWKISRPDAVSPTALAGWIVRTEVTRALLPPALCETLAEASDLRTLHTVFTGGGPVFPGLVSRLIAAHPRLRVLSVYGSTEAEPIADLDWSTVDTTLARRMAQGEGLLAGPPVRDVQLRINDDEIQVAGPHVNRGYLDPAMDEDNKIIDGDTIWHRTGDAGRLDDAGHLWLLGRHSAIVETEGGRLYPFAVEVAARSWPGVTHAALCRKGGQPVLAIEGKVDPDNCRQQAKALGITDVRIVEAIPMDRRHRSKVDYAALGRLMR